MSVVGLTVSLETEIFHIVNLVSCWWLLLNWNLMIHATCFSCMCSSTSLLFRARWLQFAKNGKQWDPFQKNPLVCVRCRTTKTMASFHTYPVIVSGFCLEGLYCMCHHKYLSFFPSSYTKPLETWRKSRSGSLRSPGVHVWMRLL